MENVTRAPLEEALVTHFKSGAKDEPKMKALIKVRINHMLTMKFWLREEKQQQRQADGWTEAGKLHTHHPAT